MWIIKCIIYKKMFSQRNMTIVTILCRYSIVNTVSHIHLQVRLQVCETVPSPPPQETRGTEAGETNLQLMYIHLFLRMLIAFTFIMALCGQMITINASDDKCGLLVWISRIHEGQIFLYSEFWVSYCLYTHYQFKKVNKERSWKLHWSQLIVQVM